MVYLCLRSAGVKKCFIRITDSNPFTIVMGFELEQASANTPKFTSAILFFEEIFYFKSDTV